MNILKKIIKKLYYKFVAPVKPGYDRLIRLMISSTDDNSDKEFYISKNIFKDMVEIKSLRQVIKNGAIRLYGYKINVNVLKEDNIIKFGYKDKYENIQKN